MFKSKVRPTLSLRAQKLVDTYEATPGSTGPGCCPEALASVLEYVACYQPTPEEVLNLAHELRGTVQS